MPLTAHMTEIDAVNMIIASIGEAPVDTVAGLDEVDEAAEALRVLNERSKKIQMGEWNFNTRLGVILQKTADDTYEVAANVLEIDTSNAPLGRNTGAGQRDAHLNTAWRRNVADTKFVLYNVVDDREDWPNGAPTITVDVKEYLEFEHCPPAIQWYIAVDAAHTFQKGTFGSTTIHAFTKEDLQEALILATNFDEKVGDNNLFDHNPHMRNVAVRNNPIRPGRRRL